MNTHRNDNELRELFQKQRREEAPKVPTLTAVLDQERTAASWSVWTPSSYRMALAATIIVCVGLALAVRMWLANTPSSSITEWASLSEWKPTTDTLLENTPTAISDATLSTDEMIFDDTSVEINNQQEVL